jgi:hypothetical protein
MDWNRISLFKLPKAYRRFDYTPRYYDARKEALNAKIAQFERENNKEESDQFKREITFKSTAEDTWGHADYKSQAMRSNIRLLIILGVILAVFYYLFIGLENIGPALDTLKK